MYEYRKMTPAQRAAVLAERKARGYPLHEPPHFEEGVNTCMLTGVCFEHKKILTSTSRRLEEFSEALICGIKTAVRGKLYAWVVLPNHDHLLAEVDLAVFRAWIGSLHNGKSTQWIREDDCRGRRVWYRFSDRKIRNDRHFYASVNYIHFNPVRHKCVEKASDWPWNSLHSYVDDVGPETLAEWWHKYPIDDYGKGWDD
jgi:putative transposase